MSLTFVLIVVGAVEIWRTFAKTRELAQRQRELVALRGVVIHFDEVLTMSARMAVATEHLVWEERYRKTEPELDTAIKKMLALAPDADIAKYAAQTDAANRALVEMENRGFALVRAGAAVEAAELLFGTTYERQKKLYAAGMSATMTALEVAMDRALDVHDRRVLIEVILVALFLVITCTAWGRALWQLRQREHHLAETLETSKRDHAALVDAHAQLEKLHRELIAREKLSSLGMLAAGVAHEINNPMAFVTMNVQTLIEDMQGMPREQIPEPLRIYLDELLPTTIDGIHRVNTIVRDLQQFARGDIDTDGEFDLNTEIAAAARISNNQLKGRARLDLDLAELPPLHGKSRQMTPVMINLIINAAHAIDDRPDGTIRVTTRRVDDRAVVEVRDNGRGMSRDVMDRVFQPFFTTKAVPWSTGSSAPTTARSPSTPRSVSAPAFASSCPFERAAMRRASRPCGQPD